MKGNLMPRRDWGLAWSGVARPQSVFRVPAWAIIRQHANSQEIPMTSLRRFALVALLLSLAGTVVTAQHNPALFNVKQIYVEKMDNNLDQYITSEISRQFHGSLTVVLSPREADAIIKGINVGAQNTTQA